jgi:alpha-N-arabinofuranosidase
VVNARRLGRTNILCLLGLACLQVGLAAFVLNGCQSVDGQRPQPVDFTVTPPVITPDQQLGKLVVHADQPGPRIDPLFYGLMTEEINYSYDGGLYAELIRNRIFRDPPVTAGRGGRGGGAPAATPNPIPHWTAVNNGNAKATLALDTSTTINTTALTTALKVTIDNASPATPAGVANDGYWGIPIKPSTTYTASFYARGDVAGPLNVAIASTDGKTVYAAGKIPGISTEWKKYTVKLTTGPNTQPFSGFTSVPPTPEQQAAYQQALAQSQAQAATQPAGTQPQAGPGGRGRGRGGPQPPQPSGRVDTQFTVTASSPGNLYLNLVSLMPPTYKNRPNGMRPDLMQLLADMKPAFLRFPGGNYVEGSNFANRWNWKETIGPLEERPGHMSPWGYRSTDGVGLLEFLNWCEDLDMEPVVAVYAGLHLNGGGDVLTGDKLKPFVQDALDEIEYITGDVNTPWGARRAKDGHPKPFKFRYMEIGNEDFLNNGRATYNERFAMFYDAIKAKYPEIKVVATTAVTSRKADVLDDHYYMNAQSALTTGLRYNNKQQYPRGEKDMKIFIGEWATRDNLPTGSFRSAMSDAAFLITLEHNADLIPMTCYAPLFVNVNPAYPQYPGGPNYGSGMQWATDLIGYDSLNSFGATGYYVQKMFSNHKGDVVLPADVTPQTDPGPFQLPGRGGQGGGGGGRGGQGPQPLGPVYASVTRDDASGDVILKVVNYREVAQLLQVDLQGVSQVRGGSGELLTGKPEDVNTIAEPTKVAPKRFLLHVTEPKFAHEFPAYSVSVIRLKTR